MHFASAAAALRQCADKIACRSVLGDKEIGAICDLPVRPVRVDAHREVARPSDRRDHLHLVADGAIARFGQTQDGRRQLTAVFITGDLADLPSFMRPAMPVQLVALTPVTLFRISHAAITALVERHPAIGEALWRECVIEAEIVAQWLVNVGRKTARSRLGHLICELAWRQRPTPPAAGESFVVPFTQEQMADALGLTSVHINRSLRSLREDGLVAVGRMEATILDWRRLASEAEFDPAYLSLPAGTAVTERRAI